MLVTRRTRADFQNWPQTFMAIAKQTIPQPFNGRSCVKVWIRTKPTDCFAKDLIFLQQDGKTIDIHSVRDPKQGTVNNQIVDWSFSLDGVLHNVNQEHVYDIVAKDVVSAALDGYNGTLLCYGQTGAGKTYTMTGITENYEDRGIIPRSLSHLFKEVKERSDSSIILRVSYFEMYNETLYDLFAAKTSKLRGRQEDGAPDTPLSVKGMKFRMEQTDEVPYPPLIINEDSRGINIKGLESKLVESEREALNMLFEGEENRAHGEHLLNQRSSRSHCIFTIHIESQLKRAVSNAKSVYSKLNFIDLAGSERIKKTQSKGKTRDEAVYINKSLSFLEQVVHALANRTRCHVPFRQSKLTHYLKDSIGGNCNTRLIANIWSEAQQIDESISTLRFATRMKNVAVEACVNVKFNPLLKIQSLEKEVELLKKELLLHDALSDRSSVSYDPLTERQRHEIRQVVCQYLDGRTDEIEIVNLRQIRGVFETFREIANQISCKMEYRLRSRFDLITESDPGSISSAQLIASPSQTEHFEEFRQGVGCEINRILVSNKDVLAAKKKAYTFYAKQINCTMSEIDRSLEKLTELIDREAKGSSTKDDEGVVISQTECLEIKLLKDLKAVYGVNFNKMREIKLQVRYFQNLVERCRQRLIREFDNCYAEKYLDGAPEAETNTPSDPKTEVQSVQYVEGSVRQ